MTAFTYPEVGATRIGQELPPSSHHARVHARIGAGRLSFDAAAHGLVTWRMHRRCGMSVDATDDRAGAGVRVTTALGAGPLRLTMPCEVVWTVDEPDRIGFAYGTLRGHPASGEEAFVVAIDGSGTVTFTVTAFSRPATWYARLGGPLTRGAQALAVRRYVAAMRRLAADADSRS